MFEATLIRLLLIGDGTNYNDGDILVINWDGTDIKVYLNGGLIIDPSTAPVLTTLAIEIDDVIGGTYYSIIEGATSGTEGIISKYQFCDGTTLVRFRMQTTYPPFPYMYQDFVVNSVSCSATPVVCDLEIDNLVTIINATNKFTSDGQITVNATSSNGDIQYSLSSFSFGSGQSSGVFSGLLAGTYTIYAVDEVGCVDNIQVTVGEDSITYNDYIFYEYMDKDKLKVHEIRIQRLNWNGDVKVVTHGSGMPVNYVKQSIGIHEKLGGVEGSALEVNLWANFNGEFRNLYTQNDRRYRVIWSKDEGSGKAEVWRGWIQPSIYSEPYLTPPYEINIVCYDGLSTLDQFDFTDDSGNILRGQIKVIDVIALVLRKLDLNLGIRVNCNLFEISQDESEGFIWDQALLDMSWFRNDKNEPKTCSQVMNDILTSVGGRLLQWGGYWWLTRREDETETYTYREFDKNGQFVGEDTYNPLVTEYRQLMQDQVLEIIPSYGLTIFERPLNERLSLIPGEFEIFDLIDAENNASGFRGWTFNLGTSTGLSLLRLDRGTIFNIDTRNRRGEAFLQQQLTEITGSVAGITGVGTNKRTASIVSAEYPIQYRGSDFIELSFLYGLANVVSSVPFWVIRFELRIGDKYLESDLTWSDTPAEYRFYPDPKSGLNEFNQIIQLPEGGLQDTTMSFKIFNYRTDPDSYEFASVTALRGLPTDDIEFEYKTDVFLGPGTGSTNFI